MDNQPAESSDKCLDLESQSKEDGDEKSTDKNCLVDFSASLSFSSSKSSSPHGRQWEFRFESSYRDSWALSTEVYVHVETLGVYVHRETRYPLHLRSALRMYLLSENTLSMTDTVSTETYITTGRKSRKRTHARQAIHDQTSAPSLKHAWAHERKMVEMTPVVFSEFSVFAPRAMSVLSHPPRPLIHALEFLSSPRHEPCMHACAQVYVHPNQATWGVDTLHPLES